MDHRDVQAWLDRYVDAWRTYDPDAIGELFSEDADYRYHPWDEAVRGREAIVSTWLENPDEPGSWEASYRPWAVDGSKAVAVGTSTYPQEPNVFHNVFLIDFDDAGRCRSFTEYFATQPRD